MSGSEEQRRINQDYVRMAVAVQVADSDSDSTIPVPIVVGCFRELDWMRCVDRCRSRGGWRRRRILSVGKSVRLTGASHGIRLRRDQNDQKNGECDNGEQGDEAE